MMFPPPGTGACSSLVLSPIIKNRVQFERFLSWSSLLLVALEQRSGGDTLKGATIEVQLPNTERRQAMSASYDVTGWGLLDEASAEAPDISH